MMKNIWSFACGLIFAIGLGLSGMLNPNKVLSFLDITGNWDPSLALVMVGAIGVYIIVYPLTLKIMKKPLLDAEFNLVKLTKVDKKLVIGEILFGIGWGLTGICPGPGITNLSVLSNTVLIFLASMTVGMLIFNWVQKKYSI